MIKTIDELKEDLAYYLTELKWATDAHADHSAEALLAQAQVVKWAAEVRAAEEAIIAASGESS